MPITNANIIFDNEDVTQVNMRLGAKFSRVATVRGYDITGWTVKGVIDEIDTPVGVKPSDDDGYDLVEGGESWIMNEDNGLIVMRPDFVTVGRLIYSIPADLGKLVSDADGRTGVPRDQPKANKPKWYQYGIYSDSGGNLGFEFVGLISLMLSVVNQ